jgi:hypothetical protein
MEVVVTYLKHTLHNISQNRYVRDGTSSNMELTSES